VDTFIRHAEQILDTALEARDSAASEYLISVSYSGSIHILSEATGWSLPALAAEHGATAVYRVKRLGKKVHVEGWSAGRSCVLTRDWPAPWTMPAPYPTLQLLAIAESSLANDRSPQVWNS
jgi:hypothetical protein